MYYLRKPARAPFLTPALKLVFSAQALGEVREEVRIWDHKIHQPRPVLFPHEKGIRALRRWYAQFYPSGLPAAPSSDVAAPAEAETGDRTESDGDAVPPSRDAQLRRREPNVHH